ncbi:MAG: DUF2520 domain-containing protein [Saprospiraceae bacterium]|nr:DUF2520 domain-containing protein [Saprospiraceae bacterium]
MTIVLIGAGNLGHHLGLRLAECGMAPVQVYSRQLEKAGKLADAIEARAVNDLSDIQADADLYILAVADDAIETVAQKLARRVERGALVVHTSGTTSSMAVGRHFSHYGVLYPLQTFSRQRPLDFGRIPICILGGSKENEVKLLQLAERLSEKVARIDDQQRSRLHLAAVFINNFTNHLFSISQELIREKGLSFDLLLPLAEETFDKIQDGQPAELQTGPAARGDRETIRRHLNALEDLPALREIYRRLSMSINPDLDLD